MNEPNSPAPRRAATVLLVRDGVQGMEVLMLRRKDRVDDRNSGAYVFPGGTLDAGDADAGAWCHGIDEAGARARLMVADGGLAYYVAAIRECFEEAGVLLACDDASRPVSLQRHSLGALAELRAGLRSGSFDLRSVCERLGVRLAAGELAYHSHWLTPPGLPKRFDTRFFVAAMPPGQTGATASEETLAHRWIRPGDALEAGAELGLPHPTRRTLEAVAHHANVRDCLVATHAQRCICCCMPRMADGPQGRRPVDAGHPAYPEIELIDPHGLGGAHYAIEPGRVVALSTRVRRVTAANSGLMTGPGTNTYLVRDPQAEHWAVIDPGPADAAHVEAILGACSGRVRWILVTHSHRDHSAAAAILKARTGASVLGKTARYLTGHDVTFWPDRELVHGEAIVLGPQAALQVLHTPGHASNQLCFLLLQERLLFTGDHVMQGSTVVIAPPDGHMGEYLASLAALRKYALAWLAPGHGFLIPEPRRVLNALIAHRHSREAKVDAVLRRCGGGPVDALLAQVYDDVPTALHGPARRSLVAHLEHLEAQKRALRDGERWMAVTAEGPEEDRWGR